MNYKEDKESEKRNHESWLRFRERAIARHHLINALAAILCSRGEKCPVCNRYNEKERMYPDSDGVVKCMDCLPVSRCIEIDSTYGL